MCGLVFNQLLSILSQFTEPVANGENLFARLFLDKDTAAEALTIFTVDEMKERILHVVDTYYNINDLTVFYYAPNLNSSGDLEPVRMLVEYRPELIVDSPFAEEREFLLDEELPLGPLNYSFDASKYFLNHTDTLTLRFTLFDDVTATQFGLAPMTWIIDLIFTNGGGIFTAELWTVRHIRNSSFLLKLAFIPASIIIVSLISLGLGVKAIFTSIGVLRRTKIAWNAMPRDIMRQAWREIKVPGIIPVYSWNEVNFAVKLDFFSSWNAMECLGEIFLIVGCVIGFVLDHGLPVSDQARLFIGAGSMILCINFIKYLEYWKKFSVLVLTLQGSFLRNLRFVVSVFPLYMGFIICGYVMFAPYSPYFETIDRTAVTLFALINGDDTHAIFRDLWENYPYPKISQTYLFSFDLLFITLVLNVFLYIIEDAYQAASYWIKGAAEKLSRSHRHMRADAPLPRNWIPRAGSVEFDVPTLFRVLERAQAIKQRKSLPIMFDTSPRSHPGGSNASEDLFVSESDTDTQTKLLRQESTTMESDLDEIKVAIVGPSSPISAPRSADKTPIIPYGSLKTKLTPTIATEVLETEDLTSDVSSPAKLQAAIEGAVARSQMAFQQQVEQSIRVMQEEHSVRLQKQVSALVERSLRGHVPSSSSSS